MKQENKILVWAVLILLIAIVSFNFTGMTGELVRDRITTVTLDKTYVLPSGKLTLNIVPGSKCMDKDIDIYRADGDTRYIQSAVNACGKYKCCDINTMEFKVIDSFEPGNYYFRAYDLHSKEYIKTYFTIGVLYEPVGPSIEFPK